MARRPRSAIDQRLDECWENDIKPLLPGATEHTKELIRKIVKEAAQLNPGVVSQRTKIARQLKFARSSTRTLIAAIKDLEILYPEVKRISMPTVKYSEPGSDPVYLRLNLYEALVRFRPKVDQFKLPKIGSKRGAGPQSRRLRAARLRFIAQKVAELVVRYPRNPNLPFPTLDEDGPYIKLTEALYYVATGQQADVAEVKEICREVINTTPGKTPKFLLWKFIRE